MIIEPGYPNYPISRFWGYSKIIGTPNTGYFPFIRSRIFKNNPTISYNMKTIQQLLPHAASVEGTLKECSLEDLKVIMYEILSWQILINNNIIKTTNEELINARTFMFWDIVESELSLPFEQCFIHTPAPGSYFADTTLWSFCFIILNANNGIIVNSKTWTDKSLCSPVSEREEDWRKNFGMI